MKYENYIKLEFPSKSCNEAMARSVAGVFASQLDPTLEELGDIKTAVSEAVTNCIVHAYPDTVGRVYISVGLCRDGRVVIRVRDKGRGIPDVEKAMEPLFTTGDADVRSGLGFSVMQSLMDKVRVRSKEGIGTVVTLERRIGGKGEHTD